MEERRGEEAGWEGEKRRRHETVTNEPLLVTFQNLSVTNKPLFVTFQNLSVTNKPLFVTFQNLTVTKE
jgi:hypothetical protein